MAYAVSVTDWQNVIWEFSAHEFDTKWMITIPMALSSWQLFEAIYATDEDTSHLPGVPAEEQEEKDKVESIPAEEQNGAKVYQSETNSRDDVNHSRTANEIISEEKKNSIRREFPSEWLDKTREEINAAAKKGNARARKARKLLSDKDFNKSSNSTRSKKGK